MARIRTIKPEFPHSESLGRVSRDARLTFILLWTLADDEGRLRGNSRMLASLLFPYDEDAGKKMDGWLESLEQEGCIRRYTVEGQAYVDIPKWLDHQKIDKPSKSKIPAFVEYSESAREDSRILPVGVDQGVDQGVDHSLSGSQANADAAHDSAEPKEPTPKAQALELISFLNEKAGKAFRPVEANVKPILARFKEGYTLQDLKTVTVRKCRQWGADEKMVEYLRPKTLFTKENFSNYIGECVE